MEVTVNDELMMPCAQCCKKHLSAAIAHYADVDWYVAERLGESYWRCLLARAFINLAEADQGYESHRPFAVGLLVRAEVECENFGTRRDIRSLRLCIEAGETPMTPYQPTPLDWYRAHINEAEREYPDILTAVEREPFYRDNMSEPELRQAEVNYRLAQLKWLDENVFGKEPVEKGEADMATNKAAVKKAGSTKAPAAFAKKAACKAGKCKAGKCKGKK